MTQSSLEDPFAQWLSFKNIKFVRQFKPFDDRRFKCDFFLPDYFCQFHMNHIIELE